MQQKQDELSSHPVQSKEHRRSVDSQETGRYSVTEGKERREHEWRNELKYSKRNGLNVSLRGLHTSLTVVTDTVFLLCKNIRVNALNPDIITAAAAWLSRTRNRIDSPNPQTSRRNLEGVRWTTSPRPSFNSQCALDSHSLPSFWNQPNFPWGNKGIRIFYMELLLYTNHRAY